MKKKALQISALLLLLTIGAAIGFNFLQAQTNPPALIVHPSNFDLSLKPGVVNTGAIYVMNTTKNTLTIQTHLRNFTAQGEEGGVNLTSENTPYSLASWMQVRPETATIPSGKEVKFTYTITPPVNAEPGGHFGSVVFATVPTAIGNTGAAVSQEIASLFLARIPGNAQESALVESFTSDKPFYEFGPVTFTMRVKNNGNVHIQPFGAIEITDMLGKKVDVPITPTNVLPNAVRKISTVFKSKLLIGKYKATIIASYGSKNQPLEGTVIFYAFPIRYALLALAILLVLFVMRKRLLKAVKTLITGK